MNEIIKATGSLDSNVIVEGPSLNSSSLNFSGSVQTYEIDDVTKWKEQNKKEISECILKFKEYLSTYPKWLSDEGSSTICILLSLKNNVKLILNRLPEEDQRTINGILKKRGLDNIKFLEVRFDENKDFIFKTTDSLNNSVEFTMVNSILYSNPADLNEKPPKTVSVETKGDKVFIGGRISIDKKEIKKTIENGLVKKHTIAIKERSPGNSRGNSSGRNAYEIRADILQMAIDWYYNKENVSDDDLMSLADRFYRFVENKI